MISRFYYSLTSQNGNILQPYRNEFGFDLKIEQETPLGTLETWNAYAPIINENGINWLINNLCEQNVSGSLEEDTDITKELLKHIWLNLYNKNVGYVDIEHPVWENPSRPTSGNDWEEMKHDLGNAIWSIYTDTRKYYETIIGMYQDELNTLLDPVQSKTISSGTGDTRFNDTPQNAPVDDGYAADNYTTNITKTTTGSTITTTNDLTTKMNRINEVQNMLKDLYADWAFKFNQLIVGE